MAGLHLYRFSTEWARALLRDPRQALRRGRRLECPVCGFAGRFLDAGDRPEVRCPNCGSRERDRIIALHWRRRPWPWERARILHLSPEKAFWPRLSRLPGYVPSDVVAHKRARVRVDVQDIPYPDGHFDRILCNHVLEHVPDDRRAMAELFRVLAPGGEGIVSVPIAWDRAETWRPGPDADPEEVARLCGRQHLRLYGLDFPDLLAEAGFAVERIVFDAGEDARHRLAMPGCDRVYVVSRPGS